MATKRHWQTAERSARPVPSEPTITISKRTGVVAVNLAGFELQQRPAFVEAVYDPQSKLLGVRAVAAKDPGAHRVNPRGAQGYSFSAKSLANKFHLDLTETRRRAAHLEDGVLVVDLSEPGTIVSSNRAKR